MKFEIRNASGGQYYWRIVASNGHLGLMTLLEQGRRRGWL
jgi:uncharacterized protein YegP (UPF0339 family)